MLLEFRSRLIAKSFDLIFILTGIEIFDNIMTAQTAIIKWQNMKRVY